MLTAGFALAAISEASLPVKFSTGVVVGKSGAIPVAASPFFALLFLPGLCQACPSTLSKVGRVGQIAARFTLLAAYYGAATLPAYYPPDPA